MTSVIAFNRTLETHPNDLPSFEYAWLEASLDAVIGKRDDLSNWRDLETWPAGRLFGEKGEYRWQWRSPDGPLHGVFIGENQTLPSDFTSKTTLELAELEDSALVLWGEWIDPMEDPESNPDGGPRFYTAAIPGILDYPVDVTGADQDKTPRLLVRRYRHQSQGEFVRCVGFDMRGEEGKDG